MKEFYALIIDLESILKDSLYCEDNSLFIKNKLKYDVYELVYRYDKKFIEKLHKKLEYKEEL